MIQRVVSALTPGFRRALKVERCWCARDPFQEVDRLARQLLGDRQSGTWSRPVAMPLDAYRTGDEYIVAFDLPGVSPDSIDIDVERNVLTVKAKRRPLDLGKDAQLEASE